MYTLCARRAERGMSEFAEADALKMHVTPTSEIGLVIVVQVF